MEGKSGFRFCSPALCGGGRMRPCPALAARAHAHSVCCPRLRACLPGLPWTPGRTRLRCPARPLSCRVWIRPGSPPKDPVLLPAPRSRALLPVSPARSDQELARERERVREPSVWTVSVYYHVDTDGAGRGRPPRQDAGEGLRVAAHRQPRRARVTGRNHLGKRVTWGVFSINQRKCTLK